MRESAKWLLDYLREIGRPVDITDLRNQGTFSRQEIIEAAWLLTGDGFADFTPDWKLVATRTEAK